MIVSPALSWGSYPMPLLDTQDLLVSYGSKQILNGVTLGVDSGQITTIIGHNGAGKSTLIKGVYGIARVTGGSVTFAGQDITNHAPYDNIKSGVGYLAQGAQVFSDLTIEDNLKLGGYALPPELVPERIEQAYQMFPILDRRRRSDADTLSGGERQMLALGMTLMLKPQLLLMDEPSGALAGPIVQQILGTIRNLAEEAGVGILLVEQNVDAGLQVADTIHVMEAGKVIFSGTPAEIGDAESRRRLLGLG